MIQYNGTNNRFESDGRRPKSHLNLNTLTKIVSDILKNRALSDAEDLLIRTHCNGQWTAKGIARDIKQHNFLSSNCLAVCHKIPYASVENALLFLVNLGWANPGNLRPGGLYHNAFVNLDLLLQDLYGSWQAAQHIDDLGRALLARSHTEVVRIANDILRDFDQAEDNLYVGFAQTNSSIGQNIDLHYDIIKTGNAPVTATPRGAKLMQMLNHLERALGLAPTDQVIMVESVNVSWAKTSCVNRIGWVQIA